MYQFGEWERGVCTGNSTSPTAPSRTGDPPFSGHLELVKKKLSSLQRCCHFALYIYIYIPFFLVSSGLCSVPHPALPHWLPFCSLHGLRVRVLQPQPSVLAAAASGRPPRRKFPPQRAKAPPRSAGSLKQARSTLSRLPEAAPQPKGRPGSGRSAPRRASQRSGPPQSAPPGSPAPGEDSRALENCTTGPAVSPADSGRRRP